MIHPHTLSLSLSLSAGRVSTTAAHAADRVKFRGPQCSGEDVQLPSNWANEMLLMVSVTYGRKSLLVTLVHLFCSAIMVSCDRFANPLRALSFIRALIQYPFILSQVRPSVYCRDRSNFPSIHSRSGLPRRERNIAVCSVVRDA